jgi:hypothetical protein
MIHDVNDKMIRQDLSLAATSFASVSFFNDLI